jgi:hypothetical protein|tara:strand:- start:253 stop:495 length:243 start_codon:yes stop_codon:yes gene_type:complete
MIDTSTLVKYAVQVLNIAHEYDVDYCVAATFWDKRNDVKPSDYNRILDMAEKLDTPTQKKTFQDHGNILWTGFPTLSIEE